MHFTQKINNPQIIQLGRAAEIDFYQSMAVDQLSCKGIVAVTLGVAESDLNIVIDTQTKQEGILEKIDAVIAFFQEHRVDWRWVIGPLTRPASLPHYLEQKGFFLQETSPGMYFNLSTSLPVITLGNWEIREMSSDDDLAEWIEPILEAFPERNHSKKYQMLNARIPHGSGTAFRHYVGYYHQKPVSSVTLFMSNNTVMIHNLATKPAFSHQGFGKKLMVHAMIEAQKMGFKHCFLEASKSGFEIYRRIGFQVYCVYQIYKYSAVTK